MIEKSSSSQAAAEREEKRLALSFVRGAWEDGVLEGIDGDCLAQACLFAAFSELVETYGEEPAAHYAEALAGRIRNGDFSLRLARQ